MRLFGKILKSRSKIIVSFLLIGGVMLLSGCSIFQKKEQGYRMDLEIWGSVDDSSALDDIFEAYHKINPYVGRITYRKMDYDNYKKDLIDAMAAGQAPDIFLINNAWLPYFQNKIEPAPDYLLNEVDVQKSFVDVVDKDFVSGGKVYALPLSVDSLALYVNKDMFNAKGITSIPATWETFQEDVKQLTKIDEMGNIVQSGAALGTAYNVNRASDILTLLMLQQGAEMTNEEGTTATFNVPVYGAGRTSEKSGEKALQFYAQFADSSSPYYSWNSRMHYSVDAFSEGNLAMMANYSWQIPVIRNKNSKLNFTIVPIPQFDGKKSVDVASYSGFAVNKTKTTKADGSPLSADGNRVRIHEAWELIKFMTMKNNGKVTLMNGLSGTKKDFAVSIDPAEAYLKKTKRPAARKDLIEAQKSDPDLSAFVAGNLIAKGWRQTDPEAFSGLFAEAIDTVNKGSASVYNALDVAARRINQLMDAK